MAYSVSFISICYELYIQSIYNYVLEANHVSRVYNVAAVLCLRYMVHVILFRICPVITTPLPLWLQRIVACPVTEAKWFAFCL
jgi:hypothetical protein